MLVLEANMLVTIGVAFVTTSIGVAATWFFSKRHYLQTRTHVTAEDIELERVKNEGRGGVLRAIRSQAYVIAMAVMLIAYYIYAALRPDTCP